MVFTIIYEAMRYITKYTDHMSGQATETKTRSIEQVIPTATIAATSAT